MTINALIIAAPVLQAAVMVFIKEKLLKGQGKCWVIRLIAAGIALLLTVSGYLSLDVPVKPLTMIYIFLWIYTAQYYVDMDIIKKFISKHLNK